jgi:vancomycin resistance protein YoaR
MPSPEIKKSHNIAIMLLFFLIIILSIFSFYIFYSFQNKIYPGIYVAEIDLSKKTPTEALYILENKTENLKKGITIFYADKKITLPSHKNENNGTTSFFSFDLKKTITNAYGFGRSDNFLNNFIYFTKALISKEKISPIIEFNKENIQEEIQKNFSFFEYPATNAYFKINPDNQDFTIKAESLGKKINYEEALEKINDNLLNLNNQPIELTTTGDYPKITKENLEKNINIIKETLTAFPASLKYEENIFEIDKTIALDWFDYECLEKQTEYCQTNFNEQKIKDYLTSTIAIKIDKLPKLGDLKIENDKIVLFTAGEDGLETDINTTYNTLINALKNQEKEILITVNKINPQNIKNSFDLGIKELIATGESDFSGSSSNRKKNINTGAEKISGLLIKPGEEFSLIKALGEINGKTGYTQELVIKDGKTIPEYGGGLCQIGTTVFRTATNAGLPITMRKNHSYRVSYYEPAGTDATIYDPLPDFRFINDTKHHILIQNRIIGNKLYFDFYGTKDGRLIEKSDPVIYNIVKPGPTKLIESQDLLVGEKKCIEKAHNGADAYFTYKITYPDGTIKNTKFSSHYVPWSEVCLIGVEKKEETTKVEEVESKNETGTEKTINNEVNQEDKKNQPLESEKEADINNTEELPKESLNNNVVVN